MARISVISKDYRVTGDDSSLDLTSKWTEINRLRREFT